MWLEDPNFRTDMENICAADFIPWKRLKNKTILVTGGTGLIGYTLISGLLYANRSLGLNLKVLALVRNLSSAKERFSEQLNGATDIDFLVGRIETLTQVNEPVDFIIHGASQTASRAHIQRPIETIMTALHGTENMLEIARSKEVEGFVYLSSMEVYGYPERGHKVLETEIGSLSPLNARNSYPISKLQCENLCYCYANQYGVPAMIVRLTQTFGPGVKHNDTRIFAEFERCAREKQDIVLKTNGETERSYLYTADAATAILTILLKGESGQAYNAANEETYCSIAEMAERIAKQNDIRVRFEIQDEKQSGYPKPLYMDLDTNALRSLGWMPTRVERGNSFPIRECYWE